MVSALTPGAAYPLYDVAATRSLELAAQANLPHNALMRRAGLATAQLALAIAPHAQRIWLACGPGNNGGDGLEAATQLKRLGKSPVVTWLGNRDRCPADSATAFDRAIGAGVPFADAPPDRYDLAIDALLGIGAQKREPANGIARWMLALNQRPGMTLAVDVPSGLCADSGSAPYLCVRADHTLSLLTLKPGLFTAKGKDAAGRVWFDALGIEAQQLTSATPSAQLLPAPHSVMRLHDSHKGSFGDVAVVGGAPGMTGAALLAASAALGAGAGRVFVALLEDQERSRIDPCRPELMFRPLEQLDLAAMTVVAGCGGECAIGNVLPHLLTHATKLVLDADALNAIAASSSLQTHLKSGRRRGAQWILTPHPLEAARLLQWTAAQVQQDRLKAARQLAEQFDCTVVLKGSGTLIAQPGQTPLINPTGNARLATAGTGDVLAGMVGAYLAAGMSAQASACTAVYLHGQRADYWGSATPLTAASLAMANTQGHAQRR